MATFEIATRADPARVLPSLFIAYLLQQSAVLRPVTRNFVEGVTLPSVCGLLGVPNFMLSVLTRVPRLERDHWKNVYSIAP